LREDGYNVRVRPAPIVLFAAIAAALCLLGSAAGGSFPGANGLIAFTCGLNVCQALADGTSAGVRIPGASDPVWSPDGSKLAYVTAAGDVYRANADGSGATLVAANASNPTWAPDNATIAYVRFDGVNYHIYERSGSGVETQLTTGTGDEGDPAFSPDGTKLAFESKASAAGTYDVYVQTLTGSAQVPGSPFVATASDDTVPSWAPNGAALAIQEGTTIYRVAYPGGAATSIASPALDPSFSPDGTKIAYVTGGRLTYADASNGANAHTVSSTLSAADTDWGTAQPQVSTGTGGPVNTSYPTISLASGDSTPVVGHTLTASTGSWTGTFPISYKFQWKRCEPTDPVNGPCVDIANAISSIYTPAAADYKYRLRVAVTATDSTGSRSQNSEVTAPVDAIPPKNTATPPITPDGSPVVDSTLSVAQGTWSGSTPITFTYSWRRCNPVGDIATCVPIVGATSSTYSPTVSDIGLSLRVWVTGTNLAGSDVVITNHTFPVIDKPHFAPSVRTPPTIRGIALPGRQLTGDIGEYNGDAPIATGFHWYRCDAIGEACHAIPGAAKIVYHPGAADVGFTIRLWVLATNSFGKLVAQSDPTTAVAANPPHVKGRVIVGNARGNYLAGGGHDDVISGLAGNDTLLGGAGDDLLNGGRGNDVITGGSGADRINGGPGSDSIQASDGERDVIDCGPGSDHAVVDAVDVVHNCEAVVTIP
jgi:hypothetical protein